MRKFFILALASMIVFVFAPLVFAPYAGVPHLVNYQGMLTDNEGNPLNGLHDLTFRIYAVPSGGTALWTTAHNDEDIVDGLFSVILSIPPSVFNGADRYMGITVYPEAELAPRTRLSSVGYAYRAEVADTAKTFVAEVQSDMDDRYVNVWGVDTLSGNTGGFLFTVENYGVSNADGMRIITEGAGGDGVTCYAGDNAIEAWNPGSYGLYVANAGHAGMYVHSSNGNGMHVRETDSMGVKVDYAGYHGVYIKKANRRGITIDSSGTGYHAMWIGYTGIDGLYVDSCGGSGVEVLGAANYGINARGRTGNILRSTNASNWALKVYSAQGSSANNGLKVYGKFEASGTKSSVIQTSEGEERLYAIETPDVEFMASGHASLINGEAQVTFERLFQEAISSDVPLKIILTSKGGWSGLYVSEQSFHGFSVMTGGGVENIEFDWLAIGRRKGYEQRTIVPVLDVEPEEESEEEPDAIDAQVSPERQIRVAEGDESSRE
jgi:hypothetical protein